MIYLAIGLILLTGSLAAFAAYYDSRGYDGATVDYNERSSLIEELLL